MKLNALKPGGKAPGLLCRTGDEGDKGEGKSPNAERSSEKKAFLAHSIHTSL